MRKPIIIDADDTKNWFEVDFSDGPNTLILEINHPDQEMVSDRAYLTRALAAGLAPVLQWYADTGELPDGPVTAADALLHRGGNELMDAIGAQMRATLERTAHAQSQE